MWGSAGARARTRPFVRRVASEESPCGTASRKIPRRTRRLGLSATHVRGVTCVGCPTHNNHVWRSGGTDTELVMSGVCQQDFVLSFRRMGQYLNRTRTHAYTQVGRPSASNACIINVLSHACAGHKNRTAARVSTRLYAADT